MRPGTPCRNEFGELPVLLGRPFQQVTNLSSSRFGMGRLLYEIDRPCRCTPDEKLRPPAALAEQNDAPAVAASRDSVSSCVAPPTAFDDYLLQPAQTLGEHVGGDIIGVGQREQNVGGEVSGLPDFACGPEDFR